MNKFTESKIFRRAKSAFDIAVIVSMLFWLPILVIIFGAMFLWK